MPVESLAQNRAMHAAAEGRSTLGIPAKVGAEFVSATPKGALKGLPERVPKKAVPNGADQAAIDGRISRVVFRKRFGREPASV